MLQPLFMHSTLYVIITTSNKDCWHKIDNTMETSGRPMACCTFSWMRFAFLGKRSGSIALLRWNHHAQQSEECTFIYEIYIYNNGVLRWVNVRDINGNGGGQIFRNFVISLAQKFFAVGTCRVLDDGQMRTVSQLSTKVARIIGSILRACIAKTAEQCDHWCALQHN